MLRSNKGRIMTVFQWVQKHLTISECVAIIHDYEEYERGGTGEGPLKQTARRFANEVVPSEPFTTWILPLSTACYREVATTYMAQNDLMTK